MENNRKTTKKQLRRKKKLAFINLLGKRGTLKIFFLLRKHGRLRFTEIADQLRDLSTKTVVKRLRELESWQLVTREVYREIPPRVEYYFTKKGEDMAKALKPLVLWINSTINE